MKSNLLTASRLRAYRRCNRLERFLYIDGWRAVREDENLSFGTLWHLAMEWWWLAHKENRRSDALDVAMAGIAGKAKDPFAQVKCEEMLRVYDALNRSHEYEVLGTEMEWRAPLINPDTMRKSETWRLAGKIDLLLRDREGRIIICDHKTSSQDISPGSDYWADLVMDTQISAYFLGAEALGFQPDHWLHDVAKKPGQKPLLATPAESRKYTKDGRLYATQRESDESPEEYRVRVRQALAEAPTSYFVQQTIPRLESQIRAFLAETWQLGRSMRENHLAGRSIPNPDSCHSFGRCPFYQVCGTGSAPENFSGDYQHIDWPHPELQPEAVGQ